MLLLPHHPAWLCLAPRDTAKTISQCLAVRLQVTQGFQDPKIFLVTLKPALAKDGDGLPGMAGAGFSCAGSPAPLLQEHCGTRNAIAGLNGCLQAEK